MVLSFVQNIVADIYLISWDVTNNYEDYSNIRTRTLGYFLFGQVPFFAMVHWYKGVCVCVHKYIHTCIHTCTHILLI